MLQGFPNYSQHKAGYQTMHEEYDVMKTNPFNSSDDKDLHFMWEAIRTMSREQEFIIDKFQDIMAQICFLKSRHNEQQECLNEMLDVLNKLRCVLKFL